MSLRIEIDGPLLAVVNEVARRIGLRADLPADRRALAALTYMAGEWLAITQTRAEGPREEGEGRRESEERVLDALREKPMRAGELSEAVGFVGKSSIYRPLRTLMDEGAIIQGPDKRYRLPG